MVQIVVMPVEAETSVSGKAKLLSVTTATAAAVDVPETSGDTPENEPIVGSHIRETIRIIGNAIRA